jgi:signal peptidase I
MFVVRWFISKTVREATAMRRHVEKLLRAQRDLLTPQAIESVQAAANELRAAVAGGADKATMQKRMENLEKAANKWLKPYPHAAWRENVEVLLVALAVAMAIRTFFLQPFKIPTGSMQPTLFGVTSMSLAEHAEMKPTTGLERVKEWFGGVSYVRLVAEADGPIQRVEDPLRLLIFNIKQTIWIGGKAHLLWFPPDCGQADIATRAGIRPGTEFKRGDTVLNVKVQSGDHLFVDRLSYNFRKPKRGEIIVFETSGIAALPQDQFYIKRLVALGGERVQIGDDRHLVINGERLDAATTYFENVYSFDPRQPPRESQYSGHVKLPYLAPLFADRAEGVTVAPDHYMVMGDNTLNSKDSRDWGDFPSKNVIGKSFFVYWPITDRFGWGHR